MKKCIVLKISQMRTDTRIAFSFYENICISIIKMWYFSGLKYFSISIRGKCSSKFTCIYNRSCFASYHWQKMTKTFVFRPKNRIKCNCKCMAQTTITILILLPLQLCYSHLCWRCCTSLLVWSITVAGLCKFAGAIRYIWLKTYR